MNVLFQSISISYPITGKSITVDDELDVPRMFTTKKSLIIKFITVIYDPSGLTSAINCCSNAFISFQHNLYY